MRPVLPDVFIVVKDNPNFLPKIFDSVAVNVDNTHPLCGAIAQLGERNTGSVEVSGSIPLSSTNKEVNSEKSLRPIRLVA